MVFLSTTKYHLPTTLYHLTLPSRLKNYFCLGTFMSIPFFCLYNLAYILYCLHIVLYHTAKKIPSIALPQLQLLDPPSPSFENAFWLHRCCVVDRFYRSSCVLQQLLVTIKSFHLFAFSGYPFRLCGIVPISVIDSDRAIVLCTSIVHAQIPFLRNGCLPLLDSFVLSINSCNCRPPVRIQ